MSTATGLRSILCRRGRTALATLGLSTLLPAAAAQTGVFSIDFQSPPVGAATACGPAPFFTEADILLPFFGVPVPGPSPLPCVYMSGGPGGLGIPGYAAASGHAAGTYGFIEVDAISFGDARQFPAPGPQSYAWWFSVDEFAAGLNLGLAPSVFTEGIAGNLEASADVFWNPGLGGGPFPCFAIPPGVGNFQATDGDGIFPSGLPGIGLIEPNPPAAGIPDIGTNIDGLDVDVPNQGPPVFPVYFSLDFGVPDILEGVPNSKSAATSGLGVGGDVFVVPAAGAAPQLYASAAQLGLDLFGADSDDLDALIVWDNGNGVYDPPAFYFQWTTGTADMVLFSVRRGSAIIGIPDSSCGYPIEPGDVLAPPLAAGATPFVWVPAEFLGLATARTATALFGDDLDALDLTCTIAGDCNGDGVVDQTDLALLLACYGTGACCDLNGDGITDQADLALLLAGYGQSC